MPIYLRALTDEPAEQAVHNAIIAQTEQKTETADDYQRKSAIPIEAIEDRQSFCRTAGADKGNRAGNNCGYSIAN